VVKEVLPQLISQVKVKGRVAVLPLETPAKGRRSQPTPEPPRLVVPSLLADAPMELNADTRITKQR
jgi:hypothetical protein